MNVQTLIPSVYGYLREKYAATWAEQIATLEQRFVGSIERIQMPGPDLVEIPTLTIKKSKIIELLEFCKTNEKFEYDTLTDLTAVDEETDPRFQLVYLLFSTVTKSRIRFKVSLADGEKAPTLTNVFISANWAEREVFDMFGIVFEGHPDLRRILMDIRWEGHPLRKDYPLRGYQSFITPEPIHPELLK